MTEYPPWDSFSIIPLFLANLVSILSVKNSCKTIFYMYDLITRDTITWLLASGRGTPLFCLHRDMLLNRVRFIDLAVLNRVYNFTSLCPKQGWVGSPLSPACKSKWASIKQLGQRSLWQEAPRKWACLDLCKVLFLLHLTKVNYHWMKSGKSESLMLDRLLYYLSVEMQWVDFKWIKHDFCEWNGILNS